MGLGGRGAGTARMDGFNEQLREVEKQARRDAKDCREMSPEARKACQARVDETLAALMKIRKDLKQADVHEGGDARTVQVLGLRSDWRVKASDFEISFEKAAGVGRQHDKLRAFIPDVVSLTLEPNYVMDKGCKVLPGVIENWYITFGREEDACYALGLEHFDLRTRDNVRPVKFAKPTQSSATRATFRKIGRLVERVRAIREQLAAMGAVWDGDKYKPDDRKYMDKFWFAAEFAGMKRAREAGQSIDRNVYGALKERKPVDTDEFLAQCRNLYDEECDCLISLREFQVNGVEFDF